MQLFAFFFLFLLCSAALFVAAAAAAVDILVFLLLFLSRYCGSGTGVLLVVDWATLGWVGLGMVGD